MGGDVRIKRTHTAPGFDNTLIKAPKSEEMAVIYAGSRFKKVSIIIK